jgi:hypothetical protein
VKSSPVFAALVPPEVVTKRVHVPALASPPVTAVISVGETTLTFEARIAPVPAPLPCPMTTVAPGTKPVPVIVTKVPPVVGPDVGLTDETVGATAAELLA